MAPLGRLVLLALAATVIAAACGADAAVASADGVGGLAVTPAARTWPPLTPAKHRKVSQLRRNTAPQPPPSPPHP
eukprot:SM008636S22998  [mRNA]  locus=s8636:289:634:+ [translate_table: standard]